MKNENFPAHEGQFVEFKQKPSSLEKEIVSFANASGGIIYIGINDQGEITALKESNRTRSEIVNAINNCQPKPNFNLHYTQGVYCLEILQGISKPYRAPDGFYYRKDATSYKLSRDEIINFYISENVLKFDSQIIEKVVSLSESKIFSSSSFTEFLQLSKLEYTGEYADLLESLELISRTADSIKITHALALLFSKKTKQIFPQARIIIWDMEDEVTIADQRVIYGNLFEQLAQTMSYLRQKLKVTYEIENVQRKEKFEIPESVLRELTLNALIHRDYFEKGAEIQIKIYSDYIDFSNPGRILYNYQPQDVFGRSFRRNPIIAEVMERAGYIERAGTGLLRIRKILKENKLPDIQIEQEGIFFIAKVYRQSHATTVKGYELTLRQQEILNLLTTNQQGLSTSDLAKELDKSERIIRTDLKLLKTQGILISVKDGRSVRYLKVKLST